MDRNASPIGAAPPVSRRPMEDATAAGAPSSSSAVAAEDPPPMDELGISDHERTQPTIWTVLRRWERDAWFILVIIYVLTTIGCSIAVFAFVASAANADGSPSVVPLTVSAMMSGLCTGLPKTPLGASATFAATSFVTACLLAVWSIYFYRTALPLMQRGVASTLDSVGLFMRRRSSHWSKRLPRTMELVTALGVTTTCAAMGSAIFMWSVDYKEVLALMGAEAAKSSAVPCPFAAAMVFIVSTVLLFVAVMVHANLLRRRVAAERRFEVRGVYAMQI